MGVVGLAYVQCVCARARACGVWCELQLVLEEVLSVKNNLFRQQSLLPTRLYDVRS